MDTNVNPSLPIEILGTSSAGSAGWQRPPEPGRDRSALYARFAWRGIAEAAALILGLLAVDLAFGSGHRFLGVEPHPFGLAVLLVAAQYGTAEAAATAILATIALLLFNLPEQRFDQDHYVWLQSIVRDPLIWLTTSLVIGEITGRIRQRAREGASLAQRREQELGAMVHANSELVTRVTTLETRIAGQQRTVTSIYEAARSLGPGRDAVLTGALALLRAATGATRSAIYLLRGDALHRVGSDGWDQADERRTVSSDDPFFAAIIGERRCLLANSSADREALAQFGLIAGPIVTADGAVLGALAVELMPFTQLHLGAVANFRSVCEWVGAGLDQAARYEDAEHGRFLVQGSSLVAAAHSDRLIGLMGATARRIGFDLSLLQIDLDHEAEAADRRSDILAVMEALFRDTDLLLEGKDASRLRVLMPGTPLRNVPLVAERLRSALADRDVLLRDGIALSWVGLNGTEKALAR